LYKLTHQHLAYVLAWSKRRPFYAKSADMYYDEMIEDEAKRAALLDDISSVSAHM
jgi:hypothetical protein